VLTNAYRHSGTKNARVDLQVQGDLATVQVRDYGKGIPEHLVEDPLKFSKSFGVGLAGMRERLRQLNGKLMVSREEPGTKIEARIPLFGTVA